MMHELEIIGSLMPHHMEPGTRIGNGDAVVQRVVVAADVLRRIDDAERTGARVLLVVLETLGGTFDCGLEVYRRLRAFSERGGRVVAFIQGRCASTGPIIAQAADWIAMRADAKFEIHGAHAPAGVNVQPVNDAIARILSERTGMSLSRLRVYCSEIEVMCSMHDLGSVRVGWADVAPVTLEQARSFARLFAQGCAVPETPRTRRLAGRPAAPVEAGELAAGVVCHQTASSDGCALPTPSNLADPFVAAAEAAAGNWTAPTLPAGTPRGTCYARGPGLYVMVGDSGYAAWSTNGTDWTAATTVPNINCVSVAYSESLAIWAAVGNGVAMSSTDAKTWTQRTITGNYTAVTVAPDGKFAAVGLAGAASRSVNGTSWSAASTPPVGDYYAIGSSPTSLVAVGNNKVATSPTGDVWTARTPTFSGVAGCVAYGGRPAKWILVVGGSGAGSSVSLDDGVTWAAGPTICTYPTAIGWNGLIWLVTQTSLLPVLTSREDGATWTPREAVYKYLIPTPTWGSVAFGNRWCAAGASAGAMVSAAATYPRA